MSFAPLEDGLLLYTSGFLLCRFERILGFWGRGRERGWDLRCKAGLEAGDFLVFDGGDPARHSLSL